MAFESFQFHCLKKKRQTFFQLVFKHAHLINGNTKSNTCQKSILSLNNFDLKLIVILEKIGHVYSMVQIKTLKDKTLFSDQTLKVC